MGRKTFSRGIWAPAATIDRIRAELEAERSTEGYARRQEAASRRREKAQAEYVEDFHGAVLAFLAFHPAHADLADRLARAVTEHATPVGSGTVARTKRIPVEQRAEAAVIAWMRHRTTGYDGMAIPRVKGKRREVRRMLARRSQELLERYRRGEPVGEDCPLRRALAVEGRGRAVVRGRAKAMAGERFDGPDHRSACRPGRGHGPAPVRRARALLAGDDLRHPVPGPALPEGGRAVEGRLPGQGHGAVPPERAADA